MKLADAHLHLFRQGFAVRYGAAWAIANEVELYDTFRRVHGIERGLVVGYEGLPQYRRNNRDLAGWAKQYSWITPLAYHSLAAPPKPSRLTAHHEAGFAGIALYAMTAEDAEQLNRWPEATLDWLNEQRQIVSLNASPEVLSNLAPFMRRLGRCAILVSHLGLPGSHAQAPSQREARLKLAPLRALAGLPHVGVKVSALYAISEPSHDYPHRSAHPFLKQLHDDFGPQRLYWGSDFSPALEHVSFAQTIDALAHAGWPDADLKAIMGDNLRRLLKRHDGKATR